MKMHFQLCYNVNPFISFIKIYGSFVILPNNFMSLTSIKWMSILLYHSSERLFIIVRLCRYNIFYRKYIFYKIYYNMTVGLQRSYSLSSLFQPIKGIVHVSENTQSFYCNNISYSISLFLSILSNTCIPRIHMVSEQYLEFFL